MAQPVTSISDEAQRYGFALMTCSRHQLEPKNQHLEGYRYLELPCLERHRFIPSLHKPTPGDYFTRIEFDPNTDGGTAALFIETNSGEKAAYVIDQSKENITLYNHAPDGRLTSHHLERYISDLYACRTIRRQRKEGLISLADLSFDLRRSTITASKDGIKHNWTLDIPSWMKIEVLDGRLLLLSDKEGFIFVERLAEYDVTPHLGGGGRGDFPYASIYMTSIRSNNLQEGSSIPYSIGNLITHEDDLPSLIGLVKSQILRAEVRRRKNTIYVSGKRLHVFGPNREGDYLLRSSTGNSEIFYNGKRDDFRLGRGWFEGPEQSTILGVDRERGVIRVESQPDPRRQPNVRRVYQIQLIFNNEDPQYSYKAQLV